LRAAIVLAVGAAAAGHFGWAVVPAILGAVVAALMRRVERPWTVLGVLWIAGGCIAFLWLGRRPDGGQGTIFWLLGVVWATDVFAYFVGKTVGGPRLAPQFSPNKTWSGLVGGLIGAAIVGAVAAAVAGQAVAFLIVISLVVSLGAQGGDLAESAAKRHFSVKDASNLIPGHGGVLDRLDGLLAGALAAALLTLMLGGAALKLG
jgi:phosphatidate cytidylyltransferase